MIRPLLSLGKQKRKTPHGDRTLEYKKGVAKAIPFSFDCDCVNSSARTPELDVDRLLFALFRQEQLIDLHPEFFCDFLQIIAARELSPGIEVLDGYST